MCVQLLVLRICLPEWAECCNTPDLQTAERIWQTGRKCHICPNHSTSVHTQTLDYFIIFIIITKKCWTLNIWKLHKWITLEPTEISLWTLSLGSGFFHSQPAIYKWLTLCCAWIVSHIPLGEVWLGWDTSLLTSNLAKLHQSCFIIIHFICERLFKTQTHHTKHRRQLVVRIKISIRQ